jgi:hypothetical protein
MSKLTKQELIEEIKERNIGMKNLQKLKKEDLIKILSDNPVTHTQEQVKELDLPVLYPISLCKK